jgi:hypothetical protein
MYLQKVISKKISFFWSLGRSVTKIAGPISQRHGSADPDRYQNFTDPQLWYFLLGKLTRLTIQVSVADP